MRVGILYEGDYDQEPFSILLRRIRKSSGDDSKLNIVPSAAKGSIISKGDNALKLFFDVTDPCETAVLINDMDNKLSRCRSIKAKVSKYKQGKPEAKITVLCPDPCFEIWFFDEENALKSALKLPMEDKIPYAAMHPKTRLEKLIYEFNDDYIRSKMDIYKEIAESINIQTLYMRNEQFKKLYLEFI